MSNINWAQIAWRLGRLDQKCQVCGSQFALSMNPIDEPYLKAECGSTIMFNGEEVDITFTHSIPPRTGEFFARHQISQFALQMRRTAFSEN